MSSLIRNCTGSARPIAVGILLPIAALLLTTFVIESDDARDDPADVQLTDAAFIPGEDSGRAVAGDTRLESAPSPVPQGTEAPAEDPAAESDTRRFTVAIGPPAFDAEERRGAAAVPAFHDYVLASLDSIASLEVIELSTRLQDPTPEDADFYLETSGELHEGPPEVWVFRVDWTVTRDESGGWSKTLDSLEGELVEDAAVEAVAALRRFPFPPLASRPAEIEAIALDSDRAEAERFDALMELRDIPERFEFVGRDEQRLVSVAGAAIVRSSPDPEIRRRAWQAMVGAEDPYLIGPLVDSLLLDQSDFVRVEATRLLAHEYSDDPRAQSALLHALVNDLSPQVRTHARWETGDDPARRAYLAATLGNRGLSDAERLELVAADVRDLRDYLDRSAVMSLVDIASRARPSAGTSARTENPGAVDAADIVPLLVEYVKNPRNDQRNRSSVVSALSRHIDEPGVREAFTLLASNDSSSLRWEVQAALSRSRVR